MSESKQPEQPTLELIYFDIPGRGEPIRKAFKFGGIKFTDTRIAFKDWPTVKPTTSLGSVPVLKVDGTMICQSMAILRYAGRLSGLYPDGLDQLNCDEILEIATEIMTGAPKHADEKEKLKLRGEWAKGALKKIFDLLEKRISERSKNGEWSAGKEFSIADLLLEGAIDMITSGGLDGVGPKFLEPYKACVAVAKKVKAHPKLQ